MFKDVKVKDRVFDYTLQKFGNVIRIDNSLPCPIRVSFDGTDYDFIKTYTLAGMCSNRDVMPTLFWDSIDPVIPPIKPMPVDTKIIVWNNKDYKEIRYFSHFSGDKIHGFIDGATSWSQEETMIWDNWELADEKIKGDVL